MKPRPALDELPREAAADAVLPAAVEARLERLFRGARRAGLIHPLQHLMREYRLRQAGPAR